VQHPFSWLMEHEPEWWKEYEPTILRSLEEKAKQDKKTLAASNWCSQHPSECYGAMTSSLFSERKFCVSQPPARVGCDCSFITSLAFCANYCHLCPKYCDKHPADMDCLMSGSHIR
jgi:hypothetical protein